MNPEIERICGLSDYIPDFEAKEIIQILYLQTIQTIWRFGFWIQMAVSLM